MLIRILYIYKIDEHDDFDDLWSVTANNLEINYITSINYINFDIIMHSM